MLESGRMKTLALLLLLAAPSFAVENPQAAALNDLIKRDWDRQMREDPLGASDLGDLRFNDQWPDLSFEGIKKHHEEDQAALAEIEKIDPKTLAGEDAIDYDLFKWIHQDRLASYDFHEYLFALNQMGGIQTTGDLTTQSLRFAELKDYEDWVTRMKTFGPYMDQTIALLAQGVKEGRTLPAVVASRIPKQIDANLVSDSDKSAFLEPFMHYPDKIPDADRARLRGEAERAFADAVRPAFKRLKKYFNEDYLPHCRQSTAARDLPDGKKYYAYLVGHFTTTRYTPDQVHAIGLKKVEEIRAQMGDVMKETGFTGTLPEFFKYLREDPKFHYTDAKDLLNAYRAQGKALDPLLVKWFGREPRVPWGIDPIPADQAPDTYTAYSSGPSGDGRRAAIMSVNTYKPQTRPIYEIPALTCHEGRPGHALQLSIASELTGLPEFRRFGYFNAYGEGWALYCEVLCQEMGVYDDPYKKFGMLSYQMWRALRLVADTGLHDEGLTRDQAIKLFEDNSALTRQNIEAEVDRYISWPGQALSYMIGEIKIQELRKRAEKKLGPRFDVRGFHDAILGEGTLPLDVLDGVAARWTAAQESGK